MKLGGGPAHALFHGSELGSHLHGGLVAADKHGIYSYIIEAKHIISFQIGMDVHVYGTDIVLVNIVGEKIHRGGEDIGQILDLVGLEVFLCQVDADDDIGPHLAGDVHREVVAHATVRQHHSVGSHRGKQTGDAHRGAHGQVDGSVVPHLGLAGSHIRGDARKGDGEFEKVRRVRVAYRAAGDDLVHVLAKDEAGRKTTHQIALGQFTEAFAGFVLALGSQVQLTVDGR